MRAAPRAATQSERERAFPYPDFQKENPPFANQVVVQSGGLPMPRHEAGRHYPVLVRRLLVGARKAHQLLVASGHGGVQRFLGRLLASPDLLGFLVDDGADLGKVAQANAAHPCRIPSHGPDLFFVEPDRHAVGCSNDPAKDNAPASKIVGTDCKRSNLNQRWRNQVVKSEYFLALIPLPTNQAATFPG